MCLVSSLDLGFRKQSGLVNIKDTLRNFRHIITMLWLRLCVVHLMEKVCFFALTTLTILNEYDF